MVEVAAGRRVCREVHLETSVEQKALLFVGAHPASDAVGRLEDDDFRPSLVQHFCAGEASQTSPDDYYLHRLKSLTLLQPLGYERSHTPPPVPYTFIRMSTKLSLLLLQNGNSEGFLEVFRNSFRDLWPEIAGRAPRTIVAIGIFVIFVVLAFVLRRALKTALARTSMAPRIRILIGRMAVISTLVLGGLIFLVIVTEASLGRVITGFGLLSVGVGLAIKSPLENMVSGIMTILVAPFRIGDEIEVSGYAGRVEDISIHDTIIRTFDGKRVAIPNVDVYLNPVVNQTAYPLRRYDVMVGIHYNDYLPKAMEIAQEILDTTEGVRESPGPVVLAETLNEYSVDMILRFWSEPSMQNQFKVISDVTTNVKLAFDREGITIPFPIRTFHIPEGEAKGAGELQIRLTDESSNSDGNKG